METKRGRCAVVDFMDRVDCVVVRWGWTGEEVVPVVVFQEVRAGKKSWASGTAMFYNRVRNVAPK